MGPDPTAKGPCAAVNAANPPAPGMPAGPDWLRPLVDNVADVRGRTAGGSWPRSSRASPRPMLRPVPSVHAATRRCWCSSPGPSTRRPVPCQPTRTCSSPSGRPRCGITRAGRLPGGASDPGDDGPVGTALREATEETGIDVTRLHPLATLERMFIPPSGFHVVPVLAYSHDPGPVSVVDEAETAMVARVPVRAFVNPENRLMVYRSANTRRYAGPAFLLNHMLVWASPARSSRRCSTWQAGRSPGTTARCSNWTTRWPWWAKEHDDTVAGTGHRDRGGRLPRRRVGMALGRAWFP